MGWFRAGSSIAKLAVRRSLSQGGSYAARSRAILAQNRYFHTTLCKSKAQASPVPRPVPLSKLTDSFLDGTSSVYLEELQRAWEEDPNSVDESWDNFFRNFVGQAATLPGISGQTIQESMRLLLLGVVYETLHLSALPNYTTGGTIHIVVNNQVAFTTDPRAGRSSHIVLIRVAPDIPFDVVVDIVCYRRFGHNEIDEPSFTQPKMYKHIFHVSNGWLLIGHPGAPLSLQIYEQKLVESGQVTKEDIDKLHDKVNRILNEEYMASKDYVPKRRDWLSAFWQDTSLQNRFRVVKPEILKTVGKAIATLPEAFKPHKQVKKIYGDRAKMIETGEGVDWAVAEALAFATLLVEGNHVRLSGQDVERGTFSHRHSVLHDQESGEIYCPLDHVVMNQDPEMFTVSNSSLSEFGVLGFELGYSMENPNALVMWEAQFGDFANGAQVIFDQFVSSGEAKWLRQTGLVVLLPHGYDGQGPEHSSARLERFLQMSDDNPYVIPEMDPTLRKQIQECNWQVVNATTPANYFHVLRRQNLLRHKECKSNLSEFDDVQGHPGFDKQGTRFKRLIKDQNDHSVLKRVYYELDEQRRKVDGKDVAICRVEQLCPFPYDLVQRELKRYPIALHLCCKSFRCGGCLVPGRANEMGAYQYIAPRLGTTMKALGRGGMDDVKYAGRSPSAATATGFQQHHVKEQTELVQKALQPEPINYPF
ncbi:hypothetical protein C3L33_17148, partial [Rhododendron williamsianum]